MQVVEEERIQYLQDVWRAGVMHPQGAALLILGDRRIIDPKMSGLIFVRSRLPIWRR
jgi:hypothetical protein